ncbi:MAG: MBL fold metallo-hydrolase [Actinomycetota bacterium]
MRISRNGHSALLIETGDARVLTDPGSFSDTWHSLADLDAILITHQHPDHVDVAAIARLPGAGSSVRIVAEEAVVPMLAEQGLGAETAQPGDRISIGSLEVEVVGGRHALIHEKIPRVGNVGYVLSQESGARLYHPGDSYEYPLDGVDVLALPLAAPWAKAAEMADFLAAVRPGRAFPIHDAILSETGRSLYLRLAGELGGDGVELHPVGVTGTLEM